jgi:hypothetical protein
MNPDHDPPPIVGTHVYLLAPAWKALLWIFGAAMAIGGLAGIWAVHASSTLAFGGLVLADLSLLGVVALGAMVVYASSRYRLVLTRDGIEQRNVFTSQRLRHEQIAGWRTIPVPNGPSIVELIPTPGATKMQIGRSMRTDQVFEAWLAGFPNEDLSDEQRLQQQVQVDPAYGSDPAQRLHRLAQLRVVTGWATGVGVVIMLWGMVYPHPYRWVVALLAACPLVGLGIVLWSGGLVRLDQKARDKRPSVVFLMLGPAIALGLRAGLDLSLLDWKSALATAAVGGVVFALAAAAVDREQRKWAAFLLSTAIIGVPWSYGVAAQLDIQLDHGPQQVFATKVIDKHETTGKGAASYLTLAPWGPVAEAGDETVDGDLYARMQAGDTVCVFLNPGALGWRWYWLGECRGD